MLNCSNNIIYFQGIIILLTPQFIMVQLKTQEEIPTLVGEAKPIKTAEAVIQALCTIQLHQTEVWCLHN